MRYFVSSLLLFLGFVCTAQEYSYVHYTVKDGLAGSVVYRMTQDKDGFLWFATETGLSRYDGTRFRTFTTSDGLPDNEIINVHADSKNRVWIVPFKHSLCYYANGKIYTAETDSLLKKIKLSSEVTTITENENGDLAICDSENIYILKANNTIEKVDYPCSNPSCSIYVGGVTLGGSFAFAVAPGPTVFSGVVIKELNNGQLVRMIKGRSMDPWNRHGFYISPVVTIMRDKYDFKVYVPGQKMYTMPVPEGFIMLSRLTDSTMAFASADGVLEFNFYNRRVIRTLLKGKKIGQVLKDSEGNTWFCSLDNGIYKLTSEEFRLYTFYNNNNAPLQVTAFKKIGDTLLVGTNQSEIWWWNTKTRERDSLEINLDPAERRIIGIEISKNKELILATDRGLIIVNNRQYKWPEVRKYDAAKAICLMGDSLFVATALDIRLFRRKDLQYEETLWYERTTALSRLANTLFFGTLKGLYCIEPGKPVRYLGEEHEILTNRIAALCTDNNGVVWVGTYGDGLIGYRQGKIVDTLTVQKGLVSNTCRTFFVQDSILWVGTDKGISKVYLDTSPKKIINYSVDDGLADNVINAIVADGNMVYVGTPSGLNYFEEDKVRTQSMCNLKITGIESNKHRWNTGATDLTFEHTDNTIRFEYSGISFKSGGEILYRYKLLGLDDTWRTTSDNVLQFQSLPSGDYELQMLAENKFNIQSKPVSVRFTIKQLLWEKNWFRMLVLGGIVVLIWILVGQRIQRIRKQEADKAETNRKITELEQMALKAQMNPHFIFNCLNSIQQYVIDKDIRGANKFITDFSRLVRLTLDLSAKQWITLAEEINYISTYLALERERFESKFKYEINWAEGLELSAITVPPMIVQPYVENSIRHGVRYRNDNNGMINITFSKQTNYLLCIVEDNGVGRQASEKLKGTSTIEYQSKGMALTARRIEMINQNRELPITCVIEDLSNEEAKPTGTRVVISFPRA